VIRHTEKLAQFERWYSATHVASRSFDDALAIFAALWDEACQLAPQMPTDWREDIQADIELARVLNGLDGRR
jgi:hypothetical protein